MTLHKFMIFSAVFLMTGPCVTFASILMNGDFSSDGAGQFTSINDTTTEFTNHIAVDSGWGAAALGNRGYGWERIDFGGGNFAAGFTTENASPLLQANTDAKSTTGTQQLTFDLAFTAANVIGGRTTNLRVYAFGWNVGDTSPSLDSGNGEITQNDTLNNVNDATSLITTAGTDAEGGLNIVTQGVADNGFSLTDNGLFQSVSVNLDFGTGYDVIGFIFYGELADNAATDDILRVDNIAVVPEPSSLVLALSVGLAFLFLRSREG